jgi:ABC-type antimicrobial peptide transport system ATPase subunit
MIWDNRWVDDALIKLDKIPESQLLDKMNELNNKLIQEIQFFYTQNISLNQHFKNLKKF